MQLPKIIKTELDYIEQNLKTDIAAEELAQMAGYSTYHYYRLFSSIMGISVAGYILKRRLDHTLAEISAGRKAIVVVLEYGFDTYAGFYKAFVKTYGCSPKKYLSIYHKHKPNKPEVATMYSENELRKVLENWDIPKDLPINDVYIMDGKTVDKTTWTIGDDYILKTGDRVQRIKNLRIAKALEGQGFASAVPVPTRSGDDYLEGEEIFILTRALKGVPLSKDDRCGDDRLNLAKECGKGIAKLHKALKVVQKDFLPDEVNLRQNVDEWALPNVKEQNQQWNLGINDSFFNDYIDSFGKLYDKLPKQLIHRNPCPSYVLFADGKVTGFEDFDLSEVNVRLWDPCYCATGILSETDDDGSKYEKWLGILKAILQGYDSIHSLSADEKKAVFYVLCSIQMICIAYFESVDEYKQLARTNRRMLQFIIQSKEQIGNIL